MRHQTLQGTRAKRLLLAGWAAFVPGTGQAQGVPPLPPALIVPQGSPLDRDHLPRLPPTASGLPQQSPPPAAEFAPGRTAAVKSAAVTGSSVFPPADLAAVTAGLTGPAVPLSSIEQARQGLLARYRAADYLLTSGSAAVDARGNLRIAVVEGYIADVQLDGNIGPARVQVLRFLRRITEERPVRIATPERYLLLANDVRSFLRPAATDPAAVILTAQIATALDRPDPAYQAKRVYLMLGGAGPLDAGLVREWMRLDWAALGGPGSAAARDRLAGHLDALLADPLPAVALDGRLVERRGRHLEG